jgi:hypothetical protein
MEYQSRITLLHPSLLPHPLVLLRAPQQQLPQAQP